MDQGGEYATLVKKLAESDIDTSHWKGAYKANFINISDPIIDSSEKIAALVVKMLRDNSLISGDDPYLERYVDEIEID